MTSLLILILGLLIGFYAKDIYVKVTSIYEAHKEAMESNKAGVVRPSVSKVTRHTPIDLSSESGSIPRPSPDQIALQHIKERDKILRDRHS